MRTPYTTRELGNSFGDARLERRFEKIRAGFSSGLSSTIPQSGKKRSAILAAYRFFGNANIEPHKLLAAHFSTIATNLTGRAGEPRRVLQLTDTVELDYTRKRGGGQLGPLNYLLRRGIYLHNSLLLNDKGAPLGLLRQSYNVRSEEGFGDSDGRCSLPIEEKENYRWIEHFGAGQSLCEGDPSLEVVYIADSEADMMELYHSRTCERMHLLVRSKFDRQLADGSGKLRSHISSQPLQGTYAATVLHPKTKKGRTANFEVRFCRVPLKYHKLPPGRAERGAVELFAVEAREVGPPAGIEKPIHWVLLTTLQTGGFEQAMQVIRYYLLRWLIERFHYLIKSGGADVEGLQLETPHRLKNAITTYSIAAMDVLKMRYWAEKEPQTPINEAGISQMEHEVLYTYANREISPTIRFDAGDPPTVWEFCRVLGQISGFNPSKKQPLPGMKILVRATRKLNTLVDAYIIFCQRTE